MSERSTISASVGIFAITVLVYPLHVSAVFILHQSRWKGLLHHVTGRHEWALGDGGGPARCEHDPLPDSWKTKTIAEGSPAHIALREIVLDQRLVNSIDYYTRFR